MTPTDALLQTATWEVLDNPKKSRDGTPYATHAGVLTIMDKQLRCYRLSSGEAVFDADDFEAFFNTLHARRVTRIMALARECAHPQANAANWHGLERALLDEFNEAFAEGRDET